MSEYAEFVMSQRAPWPSESDDMRRLFMLRDRIKTYLAIPDDAFTIVAPPGWAGGCTQFYGMPVFTSTDVNRPGLTVDPRF